METQVDLQCTNVPGDWLQPLLPQPSRAQACEVVANPSSEQLAALWRALVSGAARIVGEHSDKTHHHLELVPSFATPLPARDLARWVPLLMGAAVKVVAADGGFASSTVASSAAQCLRQVGLDYTAREAPMLLAMMAHASARFAANGFFGAERFPSAVLVRVRRPDLALASLLSPAEFEVLQLRVDGVSHRNIAAARSTACRTVANQLASVYHKLGVSGRNELLTLLVKHTRACESRATEPPLPTCVEH